MNKLSSETELKRSSFFRGLTENEISKAIDCLKASERNYKKNAVILHAGCLTSQMGIILKGSVTIENNDIWGNRTILSHVGAGGFFAETYALLQDEKMLVDVLANEDCRILFIRISDLEKILSPNLPWTIKLMSNLLMISSRKNLALSERSFHISPKTIRARVMSYLNTEAIQKGSSVFDIPFDRQQLADYLNLDRSALSKELGKMKRDGLIRCHKNHFELISKSNDTRI